MKMTFQKIIVSITLPLLLCFSAHSQEVINVGVKRAFRSDVTLSSKEIIEQSESYFDVFEQELIKLLDKKGLDGKTLEFKVINIAGRDSLLTTVDSKIDLVIYNYTKTENRQKKGVIFSKPYIYNPGIGIVGNTDISLKSFLKAQKKIGVIKNSIAHQELKTYIQQSNITNIGITEFGNYNDLLYSFSNFEIDALSTDKNIIASLKPHKEFYYLGYIPTYYSKTSHPIAIGVHQNKSDLLPLINDFLDKNEKEIDKYYHQWLETAIDSLKESKGDGSFPLTKLLLAICGILLTLVLYLGKVAFKSQATVRELIGSNSVLEVLQQLEQAPDEIIKKFKLDLNDDELSRIGSGMLERAEKEIIYVGSGGFMSHKQKDIADRWRDAVYKALDKNHQEFRFKRIIDLPTLEELQKIDRRQDNKNYVSRFLHWLMIIYHDLQVYKTLEIRNTRGAAQWGFGVIIMIWDSKESLFMTASAKDDARIGTVLSSQSLVANIKKLMEDASDFSKDILTHEVLRDDYFSKYPTLNRLRLQIDELILTNKSASGQRVPMSREFIDEIKREIDNFVEVDFSLKMNGHVNN